MARQVLDEAHEHSSGHRAELERSTLCGCFYCKATFAPSAIEEWIPGVASPGDDTALCPKCGIDSVIGDAAGYHIDRAFLTTMHEVWFSTKPR